MHVAASDTPRLRSSSSTWSGGSIWAGGAGRIRTAITAAPAYTMAARRRDHDASNAFHTSAAGSAPSSPATVAMTASRPPARDVLGRAVDGGRYQRALGDRVRLREDEDGERARVEHQAVHHRGHVEADHGAAGGRRHDHQSAPAAAAVDRGPEEGRHDRERRQGQQQRQHELGPCLVEAGREEDRAGERDGDHRVAGGRLGVGQREPEERLLLVPPRQQAAGSPHRRPARR